MAKGFIRVQEERLAQRMLVWQYQQKGSAPPPAAELERQAERLVAEAHRIGKERGRNVLAILKDLVADIRRP